MRRTRYRTTPDRVGWALAAGMGVCGAVAAGLGWADGGSWSGTLVMGLVGAVLSAAVMVAVGAPLWWWSRWRGPFAAGGLGAAVAVVVTVAVLTRGFGLGLAGESGSVWISALATGAVAGFAGALLALAMWLIAYR